MISRGLESNFQLPHGLDTEVNAGASNISVSLTQRVALARAYVRNCPLLLLDEPLKHQAGSTRCGHEEASHTSA